MRVTVGGAAARCVVLQAGGAGLQQFRKVHMLRRFGVVGTENNCRDSVISD
jgi:hypothetical protein